MNQVYTFHKTVRGHLHILNGFPCEDYSASFSADDGRYHIAIIADGHGSKACFRSERGSEAVIRVALDCLKKFAGAILDSDETEKKFYEEVSSKSRSCKAALRQLTDSIIAGWYDLIMKDYKANPPTTKEMGDYTKEYQNGKNVAHIYGTTIIAALCLPCCLILLQQGDGRCDVFFKDGKIEQPIPWDDRCEDTTTTSMCDEDVAARFRTEVIDLRERDVVACYLGCDGVEDAYRDTYEDLGGSHEKMGGVHTFYKDLTCQIALRKQVDFELYLDEMLPDFSENGRFSQSGSGDDVSVAGIVDMEAIEQLIGKFQKDVRWYALEEKLFWKKDELRGKTRKHEILKKRMEDAKEEMEKGQKELRVFENKLREFIEERQKLDARLKGMERELSEDFQKVPSIPRYSAHFENENPMGTARVVVGVTCHRFLLAQFRENYSIKQENYKKLLQEVKKRDVIIQREAKVLEEGKGRFQVFQEKYNEAVKVFEEYDRKYQEIALDIKCIQNEMTTEKSSMIMEGKLE